MFANNKRGGDPHRQPAPRLQVIFDIDSDAKLIHFCFIVTHLTGFNEKRGRTERIHAPLGQTIKFICREFGCKYSGKF